MTERAMNLLEAGSGRGKILHLDCFSGLSGDMIISALLDLGIPEEVVTRAAAKLPLEGYSIRLETELRRSVEVKRFFVDVNEEDQPHRHFADIKEMIERADLTAGTKTLAVGIFEEIARAEARVHGSTMEEVHFHEVGAVDSIIDIVGAAACFDYLGARVSCGVVPVGKGFVKTRHGMLPVPAPATLLILEGVEIQGTEVESELTTPTGAAIVKRVAGRFGCFPAMRPVRVGFGAGSRCHEVRPGILRAVLGDALDQGDQPPRCWVIEANIDDLTGELAAAAMETFLEAGALDAWIEPIQMKKGRPALKMCLLCADGDRERLGDLLMGETSTIGLRYHGVGRMELTRSLETVDTPYGRIGVKVSRGRRGVVNAAPEYEDCKRAAEKTGAPLKIVMAVAAGEAQRLIEEE